MAFTMGGLDVPVGVHIKVSIENKLNMCGDTTVLVRPSLVVGSR